MRGCSKRECHLCQFLLVAGDRNGMILLLCWCHGGRNDGAVDLNRPGDREVQWDWEAMVLVV